jgi:prepilin-type N-terminal cleavage/methylation domain-containing protein
MRRVTVSSTKGFTLLEMAVALAVLILVVGNVYSVLAQSSHTLGRQTDAFDTEVQARRTLDYMVLRNGCFGNGGNRNGSKKSWKRWNRATFPWKI